MDKERHTTVVTEEVDISAMTLADAPATPQLSPENTSPTMGKLRPRPPPLNPPRMGLRRSSTMSELDKGSPLSPIRLKRRSRQPSIHSPPGEEGTVSFDMEFDKVTSLRRWVHGIAVVNFDLELGPVVESVHPPVYLSPSEAENIAFSSFPDSLQFDQGSQSHSFRIRCTPVSGDEHIPHSASMIRSTSSDGFIYGFSYFVQQKDATSKRGYLQRSVVILTHLAYPALFNSLSATLGPLFHTHGGTILEAACHNIAGWPSPTPGLSAELGFCGSVFRTVLPADMEMLQPAVTPVPGMISLAAARAPSGADIISYLAPSLSHMWSIWECLVLCEPILIFAPSPAHTSALIWWMRDLLRPIPSAIDFRPYFTIHDAEASALTGQNRPPKAGLLLGVTNPHFARACSHWPHVLSLSEPESGATQAARTGAAAAALKTGMPGPPPGWTTKTHKRHISKDRALLKKVEDAVLGNATSRAEAAEALREHFSARSAALLAPLHRYFNTLLPRHAAASAPASRLKDHSLSSSNHPSTSSLVSSSSNAAQQTHLRPFNNADFFASLKTHGAALPFKSTGKRKEFYERWLRTPAFGMWLAKQDEVVRNVLGSL